MSWAYINKMAARNNILVLFLHLCILYESFANDCSTNQKGSCINYRYSHCLSGQYYTFSGCDVGEMCCYAGTNTNHLPAIRPDQCGLSTPITTITDKIVGGTMAAAGEFPWQVSLRSYGDHMCGGILIDKKWILTAAHCFRQNHYPPSWSVVVGENDRAFIEGQEMIMKVDTLFVHSGYDQNTYTNDIAMVKLVDDVKISPYIRPVCLPDKTESFISHTCVVTGWGAAFTGGHGTHALYKANVPVLDQPVCTYLLDRPIPETMICAGLKQGGVDSCQGDSGGPMVCESNGIFKIAGIVSWGYSCAEQYTPGVYTNVPKFIDWIHSVLNAYDPHSIILGKRSDPQDVKVYY